MNKQSILWQSLLLTILIFAVGILLNHIFDTFRIDTIVDVMREHEIDTEAYHAEQLFAQTFGQDECVFRTERILKLKEEIRQVGEDLGTYSRFSFFRKKDYDILKRTYFLLELQFLANIKKLNEDCGKTYLPVLFFYEIDDDESERQGFILQDLSKDYEDHLVVLSIDKDYKDEPLVNLLVNKYGITDAPAIVIDEAVYTGLHYSGQLNGTIQQFIRRPDPFAQHINFRMTPEAANISFDTITKELRTIVDNTSADPFARGDAQLIIGRLTKNATAICESLRYFDFVNSTNPEEMALIYETSASLGCGRNRQAFLRAAANQWKLAGNPLRANILTKLALGSVKFTFDDNATSANTTVITGYTSAITPEVPYLNATTVHIGETTLNIDASSIIVSQDDRVYRDWLSGQIANPYGPNILTTFSERLTYNQSDLTDIGWHEGGRIRELKQTGLTHLVATGTLAANHHDKWYGIDDQGIFRFEIPLDKISYPTTRFLRRDLAVIIDTHGMNMMVEQAIRNNATAVVACCDHPGKIYAAHYLSQHNITAICYPDKYLYLALGHNISALGSPPQTINNTTAILGNRPMIISINDTIIVTNSSDDAYALWYYQTPASYFTAISNTIPLNATYVELTDFNQMNRITQTARALNATVIATRVFNSNDYTHLSSWLREDASHKAILFHSAPYPYGQKIFNEFANQTTFDDPNPTFQ